MNKKKLQEKERFDLMYQALFVTGVKNPVVRYQNPLNWRGQ